MKRLVSTFVTLGALLACASSNAVTVGQTDNFEDGTTQGWATALGSLGLNPVPPTNVATGGPTGADDNYLRLSSLGGLGPGSRLVAINPAQWSGNYTTAGVVAISMDVNNLGTGDLFLRLLFEDPVAGPPANVAFTTTSILVPAGSGWVSIMFPILAADLTALYGSAADALASATMLRLFHGSAAGFPGEAIVAALGVDNISAVGRDGDGGGGTSVPEPGTLGLLGIGLVGLALRRCRK